VYCVFVLLGSLSATTSRLDRRKLERCKRRIRFALETTGESTAERRTVHVDRWIAL